MQHTNFILLVIKSSGSMDEVFVQTNAEGAYFSKNLKVLFIF